MVSAADLIAQRDGRRWISLSDLEQTAAVGESLFDQDDHHHSGIRYVSPAQRHAGADVAILAARHQVYLAARERNPARWSGYTRDWSHIKTVTLNPERDALVTAPASTESIQPMAV